MRDEWYVARRGQDGNKRYGPVSLRELRDLLDSGRVRGDDLVWREGMAGWREADQCPDLAAPPARPEPRGYPASGRGDAYGSDRGPRGAYGDDDPYRRPYRRQSSPTWVVPLVIVGSAVAVGVLAFVGILSFMILGSHPGVGTSGYPGSPTYQTPVQPWVDPPVIDPGPPIWAPPPDPVWVPPADPPFVPDPPNPFIPDPPPDDDPKQP